MFASRIWRLTMLRKGWTLGLTLFLSCVAMFAQTGGTGTLVGTVTDSSGAIMPGARVTVVNSATAFTSDTLTSAGGAYHIPYLAPGTYRLTVEAPGFKRYVNGAITINSG